MLVYGEGSKLGTTNPGLGKPAGRDFASGAAAMLVLVAETAIAQREAAKAVKARYDFPD